MLHDVYVYDWQQRFRLDNDKNNFKLQFSFSSRDFVHHEFDPEGGAVICNL
jgi:hypothetical protein